MHANPKPRTSREDEAIQRAIYALVLAGFPVLRTVPELIRELGSEKAVKSAISALVGYGVLEQRGRSVLPTTAALRCHRLDAW